MIKGKAVQYKLLYIGSGKDLEWVHIFLAHQYMDRAIYIRKLTNWMIIIGRLLKFNIVLFISVFDLHFVLDKSQKGHFFDVLLVLLAKFGKKWIFVIVGDLS